MRLSSFELESIIKTFKDIFGKGKIYLFGSRLDNSKKGGDIDLYIQTYIDDSLYEKKINFLVKLESLIGEQKIDLVFQKDEKRLIEIEAKNNGVELTMVSIKIDKYFKECDKHIQRIQEAYSDIKDILPMDSRTYTNLTKDQVQDVDQYLFRFSKLQDTMGDKLFKLILEYYEEDIESLTFIDILNRLEKLNFLKDSKEWINLRKTRNDISHQYDDEPEEMSQAINNIFSKKDTIIDIYLNIQNKYKNNEQ